MTQVTIEPGATARVTLGDPASGASLRGRVTAAGRGVAGVMLHTAPSTAGPPEAAPPERTAGFVLNGISPGEHYLSVFLGDPHVFDDFRIDSAGPIALDRGDVRDWTFDLPAGRLRVRVIDAASGEPLAGAEVCARPEDDGVQAGRFEGFRFRPGWAARTDASGEVSLVGLPEGEPHRVEVRATAHAPGSVRDVLPGTREQPAVVVPLAGG